MVLVHEELVKRRYSASLCSYAFCFSFLVLVGMVVVPFYMAYGSHNFWLATNTYRDQPTVRFTYRLLWVLQGRVKKDGANEEPLRLAWATAPDVRVAYEPYIRAPIVRALSSDYNHDNVPDAWHINLRMPLEEFEEILQVDLVAYFDYTLNGRAELNMGSLAYVEYGSALPGSELQVDGMAKLYQMQPLSVRRANIFPGNELPAIERSGTGSLFPNLMSTIVPSYLARNVSMRYADQHKVWSTTTARTTNVMDNAFCVNMTMRVPHDTVLYTPDISELLKTAWIQYVSVFILFWYLFSLLRSYVYVNQVLETTVVTEGSTFFTKKAHAF